MGLFTKKEVPLITLETERLVIVPLTREEFDEKLNSGFGGPSFTEAMEELSLRAREDHPARFAWYTNRLIYRKEDGACIGSIACMNSPEKDPDRVGLIEIGYETEADFRGMGYMTEAIGALCEWILSQDKVYGIIAGIHGDNPASARVLEKNGFILADHSDALSLDVWKRIPEERRPMRFFERFF